MKYIKEYKEIDWDNDDFDIEEDDRIKNDNNLTIDKLPHKNKKYYIDKRVRSGLTIGYGTIKEYDRKIKCYLVTWDSGLKQYINYKYIIPLYL